MNNKQILHDVFKFKVFIKQSNKYLQHTWKFIKITLGENGSGDQILRCLFLFSDSVYGLLKIEGKIIQTVIHCLQDQ